MTVDNVEMEDVSESVPHPPFPTVRILQLIKDAQQQHGLRHGDYNRYRTYCRSKLGRVRRVLKFTNIHKCTRRHKAKFTKKWLTDEVFTDEKFVLLGLFEAERCWAKAMADKLTFEDNTDRSRKRHSMRMHLLRAVVHAKNLEELIRNNARCDVPTKLEAQAYASWLYGICSFELQQWGEASAALKSARAVYEGLAETTHNNTLGLIYKAKCREIQPQLRLCEFNSAETPSSVASMSELMAIRMQIGGGESVDKLIAEMRSKASSDDVVTIKWGGDQTTIDDEKTRQVVQGWTQATAELAQCETPKEKMALYEKQLTDTRDAIDKVSDLIRRKTTDNADSSVLRNIKAYLEYLKMNGTASRYLAMIENTKCEKKTKPQDLLRLYDSVIELYKEMMELPGASEDKNLMKALQAKVDYYRTFRCHYMAAAYAFLGKYSEAAALFERAQKRLVDARKQLAVLKGNDYLVETEKALAELGVQMEQSRLAARAKRMADAAGVADTDVKTAKKIDNRPLMETLDEWRSWNVADAATSPVSVVHMPPAMVAMPNKPMFFDLALNHVKMPDLEERLAKCSEGAKTPAKKSAGGAKGGKGAAAAKNEAAAAEGNEEQSGISGMMKGWFWGKK